MSYCLASKKDAVYSVLGCIGRNQYYQIYTILLVSYHIHTTAYHGEYFILLHTYTNKRSALSRSHYNTPLANNVIILKRTTTRGKMSASWKWLGLSVPPQHTRGAARLLRILLAKSFGLIFMKAFFGACLVGQLINTGS